MEGNERLPNSYNPHTTTTTSNGMFTPTTTATQNHHHHHNTQYSSSSEPTPLVFSPHSIRGLLPSSTSAPPPPPPLEAVKRKRGRPRKYGAPTPEAPSSKNSSSSPTPTKKDNLYASSSSSLTSSSKKSQLLALGNAGQGFTPHIISVAAGEDVSQKVLLFVQQRKCAVCILSASGSISTASLRQPAMLGGSVTYEGRYEILSLSGSFLYSEVGGASSRTGGLAVCLSGTDGCIIGGGVGGSLRAAGPVQVVVGSFLYDVSKNATADKIPEASLDKSPPQIHGASITSVTFRTAPDSFGRIAARENNHHQNIGGNFMLQPRGMDVRSPHLNDWRGDLDARSDMDFTGRIDHGDQSPDDGDDEQLD